MENNIPIELIKLQKKRNKPDKNGFRINDIVKIDMLKIDKEYKVCDNDCKYYMYGIINYANKVYSDIDKKHSIHYSLEVINSKEKLENSYWVKKECITLIKREKIDAKI